MTSRVKIFLAGFLNYLWNNIITHIPLHFLRKIFLRLFNKNVSRSSVILLHVRILNFWSVEVGERAVINQYVLIDCRRYKVIIDHDADIGPYSRIWTTGHQPDSNTHAINGANVIISHHVWIASGVTILPGITIGAGAVIGTGSVVTRNIPCLEIWTGIPAKFSKKRNNELTYKLNYQPYFE